MFPSLEFKSFKNFIYLNSKYAILISIIDQKVNQDRRAVGELVTEM